MRRFFMALIFVVVACLVVWLFSRWKDPDRAYKLVNFASAWFPFALSVFVAFIPDFEKAERLRPVWRICIIALGFIYSAVLWQQQGINLEAGRKDQDAIVQKANTHTDSAIDRANQHTDSAMEGANRHTDSEVGMVREDLNDVRRGLESLVAQYNQGNADLKDSISKVGKPEPPTPASLLFSLWSEDVVYPSLSAALRPDKEGVITVDWALLNMSPTAAHTVDMWIDICLDCTFAKEPSNFDRPAGMRDQTRHLFWQTMNPGATLPKQTIEVKLKVPHDRFDVGFRYSCEVCSPTSGRMDHSQLAHITVLPALP